MFVAFDNNTYIFFEFPSGERVLLSKCRHRVSFVLSIANFQWFACHYVCTKSIMSSWCQALDSFVWSYNATLQPRLCLCYLCGISAQACWGLYIAFFNLIHDPNVKIVSRIMSVFWTWYGVGVFIRTFSFLSVRERLQYLIKQCLWSVRFFKRRSALRRAAGYG